MRRRLEGGVRRWWAGEAGVGGGALSAAAAPLELAYRGAVALRNRAYDRGWLPVVEPPVPVISVGNLHVGGTGKTPVAAWIAGVLQGAGAAPALVCRGYGVDELALHRRWNPEVPVLADPDRIAAVRKAERAGRRCAVLDDAFQHRRLARSLDLVLLPLEGPWSPPLLPRGPLREPFHALRRADRVILTRRTAGPEEAAAAVERVRAVAPEIPLARIVLVPDGWRTLDGREAAPPRGPVLAATGIARPGSFEELVRREGGSPVELVAFPDHHVFSRAELRALANRAGGRPVAVTEKDAVRLGAGEVAPDDVRVLRLRVEVEDGEETLRDGILAAAGDTATPASGEIGVGARGNVSAEGGGPG